MSLDSILQNVNQPKAVLDDKVLIVYDTHISDKRSDRHVDYWQDCMDTNDWILNTVRERKVNKVIFPGDLIGRMKDKNLVTREGLMYLMMFFQELNKETNGHVYIVEGNHDQGENLTDYQMFVAMGLIKNPPYVDSGITRFHLINYGDEFREVELREGANNVAVMHNELHVDGATTWFFPSKKSLRVSELQNLKGITRIYCGHIHIPSPKPVEYMIDGVSGVLHYMGCPNKPSYNRNDYDQVFPVLVSSTDDAVKEEIIPHILKKDVWLKSVNVTAEEGTDEVEIDFEQQEIFDVESLSQIMATLGEYNLLGANNYQQQIEAMAVVSPELTEFVKGYIEKAENLFIEKESEIVESVN